MRRTLLVLGAALALLGAGPQSPAAAAVPAVAAHRHDGTVTVGGAVGSPGSYTAADIAALPQVTLSLARGRHGSAGTVTGASLEAVVEAAAPVLPAGKNTQLRVAITVSGAAGRRTTVALGELDPNFGNHPGLLTVDRRGHIGFVIPGDVTRLRSVGDVTSVVVTVSTAGAGTPTTAGSVRVTVGSRAVDLSAATLARLPGRTVTVSFLAGTAAQTHTETGPALTSVLLAAGVLPVPNATVTAVGSDGYGASVTVGEALLGGRPLLLSRVEDGVPLAQPRLVPDGDVKGGRYVSGVVALAIIGATGSSCH